MHPSEQHIFTDADGRHFRRIGLLGGPCRAEIGMVVQSRSNTTAALWRVVELRPDVKRLGDRVLAESLSTGARRSWRELELVQIILVDD